MLVGHAAIGCYGVVMSSLKLAWFKKPKIPLSSGARLRSQNEVGGAVLSPPSRLLRYCVIRDVSGAEVFFEVVVDQETRI